MNEVAIFNIPDIERMAKIMSPLFKMSAPDMTALMLLSHAEGKHPAIVAQEYDIIQGKPALKSQAILSRFQAAGGKIAWITRTDEACKATFTHPAGGTLTVEWTKKRAENAGLTGKDNWRKFPAQMLSARVVSEGVRAVFPACLSGMYAVEEVQDFSAEPSKPEARPEPRNVTPKAEKADAAEEAPAQEAPQETAGGPGEDPRQYHLAWSEIGGEIARIVGAKNSPDAWTDEMKDLLELRTLMTESRDAQDADLLRVALIRAKFCAAAPADEFEGAAQYIMGFGRDLAVLEEVTREKS